MHIWMLLGKEITMNDSEEKHWNWRAAAVGAMGYCGLLSVALFLGFFYAERIAEAYVSMETVNRLLNEAQDLFSAVRELLPIRRFF